MREVFKTYPRSYTQPGRQQPTTYEDSGRTAEGPILLNRQGAKCAKEGKRSKTREKYAPDNNYDANKDVNPKRKETVKSYTPKHYAPTSAAMKLIFANLTCWDQSTDTMNQSVVSDKFLLATSFTSSLLRFKQQQLRCCRQLFLNVIVFLGALGDLAIKNCLVNHSGSGNSSQNPASSSSVGDWALRT
jgi:hypothetical protein